MKLEMRNPYGFEDWKVDIKYRYPSINIEIFDNRSGEHIGRVLDHKPIVVDYEYILSELSVYTDPDQRRESFIDYDTFNIRARGWVGVEGKRYFYTVDGFNNKSFYKTAVDNMISVLKYNIPRSTD